MAGRQLSGDSGLGLGRPPASLRIGRSAASAQIAEEPAASSNVSGPLGLQCRSRPETEQIAKIAAAGRALRIGLESPSHTSDAPVGAPSVSRDLARIPRPLCANSLFPLTSSSVARARQRVRSTEDSVDAPNSTLQAL